MGPVGLSIGTRLPAASVPLAWLVGVNRGNFGKGSAIHELNVGHGASAGLGAY